MGGGTKPGAPGGFPDSEAVEPAWLGWAAGTVMFVSVCTVLPVVVPEEHSATADVSSRETAPSSAPIATSVSLERS